MEKQECLDDFEQKKLEMSDEKCKPCEHYYECKFIAWAFDDIVNGSD